MKVYESVSFFGYENSLNSQYQYLKEMLILSINHNEVLPTNNYLHPEETSKLKLLFLFHIKVK